jgi:quercetin dioxygenase-like cupin family protein
MQNRIRSRWLLATSGALVAGAVTLVNWAPTALATPGSGFASDPTRALVESLRIISNPGPDGTNAKVRLFVDEPSDLYVVGNTVAPGGYSGWHTHPGPSVVLVKTGTATVYDGNDPTCTPTRYPAGTAFTDPGNGHVHMVRNEGATTLVLMAFQIIPTGDARRIDAPSPGYCPF